MGGQPNGTEVPSGGCLESGWDRLGAAELPPRPWSRAIAARYAVSNSRCFVCRLCQARGRRRGEQYVAETGRLTPTVQDIPHSAQVDAWLAWTASVLARVLRICRQCRDRHADEQNAAFAFAVGVSGPPHALHNRGPAPRSSATTTSLSRGTLSLRMTSP